MNHSITIRDLADSERKRLQRSKTSFLSVILLSSILVGSALIIGIFAYTVVLWLLEKLGINFSESVRFYGFAGVTIVALLVAISATASFYRASMRARRRERAALERAKVEMITVENPAVAQQEEYNDEGPIYFLDIGKGKILFVCGQWLYEDQTYEPLRSVHADDDDDENWPPFPCKSFVIHRIPESGVVLKIEIKGPKVAPTKTIKRREITWDDLYWSLVFDGDLDNLRDAAWRVRETSKLRSKRATVVQ